jgi:hypothetical protein
VSILHAFYVVAPLSTSMVGSEEQSNDDDVSERVLYIIRIARSTAHYPCFISSPAMDFSPSLPANDPPFAFLPPSPPWVTISRILLLSYCRSVASSRVAR